MRSSGKVRNAVLDLIDERSIERYRVSHGRYKILPDVSLGKPLAHGKRERRGALRLMEDNLYPTSPRRQLFPLLRVRAAGRIGHSPDRLAGQR